MEKTFFPQEYYLNEQALLASSLMAMDTFTSSKVEKAIRIFYLLEKKCMSFPDQLTII